VAVGQTVICFAGRLSFLSVLLVKLQALVYDILYPTTANVDYAIGLENCQLINSFSMMLKWL